jgi:hypothetical protein
MKLDRVASVILFVVGALVAHAGYRLPYTVEGTPGPGVFPFWTGLCMMFLSAVLFFTTRSPKRPFVDGLASFRRPALVGGAFLVYVFLLKYVGLVGGLVLTTAFILGWVERQSKIVWIGAGALIGLACHLIFKVWLGVPLPKGILGI